MSQFKILSIVICLCVISSTACAQRPTEEATRFFKTHKNAIDVKKTGDSILLANRQIGLEIIQTPRGFQLARLYGIAENQDFLTELTSFRNIFEIRMTLDPKFVRRDDRGRTKLGDFQIIREMAGDAFSIGANQAKSVSWRKEDKANETTLHLMWKGMDVKENKAALDVEVTITLRKGDPLSYWRINIRNRSGKYGIERACFPLLTLAPIGKGKDNVFLYPRYRGGLFKNAFRDGYNTDVWYPHNFNMQFQALYNEKSKKGLYLGTQDPAASFMGYTIKHRNSLIAWEPAHFPPNITFASENFNLPYDCVVGPFKGDWYDAAQIYRKWAVKQFWCSKGKLSGRKDIPKWYKEAPLYLYAQLGDSAAGTHSLEENLKIAEKHLLEFMEWVGDVKLPCNFYQITQRIPGLTSYDLPICVYRAPRLGRWKGFSTHEVHCGNYPDVPVLPELAATFGRLKKAGAMVCPYVPLEFFDPGPAQNAPYAKEANPHALRDLYGAFRGWSMNPNWQMCPWSDWWRNRLEETCELMLERENVSGFYLDVMQGGSIPCYWTPHGHSAAGGDSMTKGMHELVEGITNAVKAKNPQAITTGENPSENMIDVTDGFLQVSLWPENTAPIFAVVYQDYILRYGLELPAGPGWKGRYKDTWKKDHFFIMGASMFVEGMQVGRLRLRPRDMAISFQNPQHKEFLDFLKQMVDYYKQDTAKKFLVYGQLLRPLSFSKPSPMPMMPFATLLRKNTSGDFPALMSGVFRSEDGELGVFIANASSKKLEFAADLDLTAYGVAPGSAVSIETIAADGSAKIVSDGAQGVVTLKGEMKPRGVTMFRLRPVKP